MGEKNKRTMGKEPMVTVVRTSRRLGRTLGTSGLVLVGGGLAAWQAYYYKAGVGVGVSDGVCGGAGAVRRPLHTSARRAEGLHGPEFVSLPSAVTERLLLAPPDMLDAREDLKSIVLPKHLRRSWKLLRQANWGDYEAHLRAVRDLARLSPSLGEGELRQLAQSSSRHTAVGLARTESVDLRLFTPPPPLPADVSSRSLPSLFRAVLSALSTISAGQEEEEEAVPECVAFFTDTALKSYVPGADDETIRDSDLDLEFERESHHLLQIPRKRYAC